MNLKVMHPEILYVAVIQVVNKHPELNRYGIG